MSFKYTRATAGLVTISFLLCIRKISSHERHYYPIILEKSRKLYLKVTVFPEGIEWGLENWMSGDEEELE